MPPKPSSPAPRNPVFATLRRMASRTRSDRPSASGRRSPRGALREVGAGGVCARVELGGVLVAVGLAAFLGALSQAALAQDTQSMPAIADSPTAQQLVDDARAQAAANPAESARLVRRLLDEYPRTLVRVGDERDGLFRSARIEAERFLVATPAVLERFRGAESRAAERMLAEAGPVETARRRRMTRAGLMATLILAERALRDDAPATALAQLRTLEGHPDLGGMLSVDALRIRAAALQRLGKSDEASATARRELARLAQEDAQDAALARAARQALEELAATPVAPVETRRRSPLEAGAPVAVPTSEWREIWSLDLDETLFRRLFSDTLAAQSPRVYERNRSAASWMTVAPVVFGSRIYVHEGHRIRAVDIDSRDPIWTRELSGLAMERDVGGVSDMTALAVDGGAVVGYEGHAFGSARSGSERIWCLDPATGEKRWATTLESLGRAEDFGGLFPVGTPQLFSDTVVVMARKPTQRLEQVDWLVALDRRDGSLRWATLVAGAPGLRMASARRHAAISADGEAVLVASPLGAVAAVAVADGSFEWLHRFPVPLREMRTASEPWELGGPVAVGARVLAIGADDTELEVLDRVDGRLLQAIPIGIGSQWGAPRYLVAARASGGADIVLSVGSDLCAFDARDLTKRLWSLGEVAATLAPPRAGLDNRSGIRGRVSVAGDAVLVPGVEDFLVLDLATGSVRARIPAQRPANAVLAADRIVAGGDDALRILMPPAQAETILRTRLAEKPDDPGAAIALLDLAQGTDRPALALEAARAAADALGRGHGTVGERTQLVERLVAIAVAHPEQGDVAHGLALEAATTPRLKAVERLAYGEFLRGAGRPREALACWREIAADRALAAEMLEVASADARNPPAGASAEVAGVGAGIARSVRLEAIQRIARLLARDVELSAALEAEAGAALAAALGANDPVALSEIVERFPRTAAAIDAARAMPSGARGALLSALDDALVPPARLDLVDLLAVRLARVPAQPDSPETARIDALLVASGQSRPGLAQWPSRLPRLGPSHADGTEIRARVPRFDGLGNLARDPSMILGLQEGALVRLAPSDLSPTWRLRLDDRDPLVLWARESIVLWQLASSNGLRDPEGPGSALVVDPASGTILFSTPRAGELWKSDGAGAVGLDPASPPSAQVLPFCDGDSILLVRRTGDLARFSVREPRVTPIVRRAVLPQVDSAILYQGALVVAGRRVEPSGVEGARIADGTLRATVVVLDPATLEERHRLEPVTGPDVLWAFATALDEVFVGTAGGVERWVPDARGALRPSFATTSSECMATRSPTLLGGALLVTDRNDRPMRIPVHAGAPAPIEVPGAGDSRVQSFRGILPIPGHALLFWDDRFALVAPSGEVVGIDSTAHEANFVAALPVEGAVLQIAGVGGRQVFVADRGAVRMDYGYLVQPLSLARGLRLEAGGFAIEAEKVDRALAVDGWVLLSSSRGTSAVPLPLPREGS